MLKQSILMLALAALFFAGCDEPDKADAPETPTAQVAPSAPDTSDSAPVPPIEEPGAKHVNVTPPSVTEKNPAASSVASKDVPMSTGDVQFSLKFLSWNVESEGSDPDTIVKELGELGRYDVIALTEVLPTAATDFCSAFGDDYNYLMSETGRSDRLMLIYNKQTLSFVRQFELHDINYKSRYRSPLVGHFKDLLSGKEILVMVNHLARGKAEMRQMQATKLVEWARDQTMPVVALGDYNFDYEFATRKGNEAFRLFMKDSIWKWIEPIELIDTNWYDDPRQPDGKDDYPGSMLDFGFVAGPAKDWTTSCKVIVREGDFPDDEKTSDHRPFEVIVSGK
ncbi:endonuclease/exonuclease/phosphatase family protein [Mariniblastus fucicola]|uniref:Endonuclease/Exonuclease/phosphatase family protein n=1 Tax=Mariniblastus fucicola TaxID=980251 RepID=A0A5B9P9W4_9BACT|nr:endonuclease/exonuclease/phosphatase family protein [Mariniblastus fucicola]QEG23094.1 Endonuclease/Exonuclease/phosphatase family protein [Mariniblastus fucicola]